MATQIISPVLPRTRNLNPFFPRSLSSSAVSFRHLSAAARGLSLSANAITSHLPGPQPHPPDGMDYEHWAVNMDHVGEVLSRDQIIDICIKTLAQVVGSEEEARMKIYWVQSRYPFCAFGALVSEELADKIRELPGVNFVFPDFYMDEEKKDYGGEPFINGQAVPYDPKYHEEWVRNKALSCSKCIVP